MPADAKLPDSGQAVPPNAVYNYWKGAASDALLMVCCRTLQWWPNRLFLTAWPGLLAEFDLETLRGTLDEKGLAIAETQEASVKSRKQLAEKTKGKQAEVLSYSSAAFSLLHVINALRRLLCRI